MVKEAEKEVENVQITNEKNFTIFGFTIWRIFAYFIIYSVIGYIIETLFGLARYGTLESRQSFVYGPFCAIYGLGAVVIILSLQRFKGQYNTLFFAGCVVGSILEYIISFLGEVILNVKWWDYSSVPLNLNGRICLLYSLFWGFLSLYLIISLNPKIDKLIEFIKKKVNIKVVKTTTLVLFIFMILDCIITGYALMCFMVRIIKTNNIETKNSARVDSVYETIYNSKIQSKIVDKYFNDKKMLRTFPRLKVQDINGNIIFFSDLLPDITPYYLKIDNYR